MAKNKIKMVIVESPAKARTIEKFLGRDFSVLACGGHVRDLPPSRLGVDVENNFEPTYVTVKGKGEILKKLRDQAKESELIYLAPDPDREGEAIAWHLAQSLRAKNKIKRIEFHEITKKAVQNAVEHPREINFNLVEAQQARRILDRLVGYKISPILWQKIRKGLSAGRVQSVAVRIICEREAAIREFKPQEYWTIEALLAEQKNPEPNFKARFFSKAGKKVEINSKEKADKILEHLKGADFKISEINTKEQKRYPAAPFITSTLQQEASRKLGYNPRKTMVIAQQLYEGIELKDGETLGLITYMRTDSVRIADEALEMARKFIQSNFGKEYLPKEAKVFKTKKQSQDAHEAIRPTHIDRTPESLKDSLSEDQMALYELIWKRFVATQMNPAIFDLTQVDILAKDCIFRASGSVLIFDGFLKLYEEGKDEEEKEESLVNLPKLKVNEILQLLSLDGLQHFTEPPRRYTEATLVKELEHRGIGRPSTYAPIMATIQERDYVEKENKFLKPTELGETVNKQLVEHFPKILDIDFTAHMEDSLDEVGEGKIDWHNMLKEFYQPFAAALEEAKQNMEKIKKDIATDQKCPECGKDLVIREGRFGAFYACSNFPTCRYTSNISENGQKEEETDEICEKCQAKMVKKHSRFGAFYACSNYPKCKFTKSILNKIGIPCPNGCGGDLVVKRTKRGKFFYGCSNYPKCTFALWDKPLNEKCPKCGSILVEKISKKAKMKKCTNANCDFIEPILEEKKPDA